MQAKGLERTRMNEESHRHNDDTAFSTFLCLKGLQGFATYCGWMFLISPEKQWEDVLES